MLKPLQRPQLQWRLIPLLPTQILEEAQTLVEVVPIQAEVVPIQVEAQTLVVAVPIRVEAQIPGPMKVNINCKVFL